MPGSKKGDDDNRFKNVKCWKPKQPPVDEFYRPLLMSIELSRPKRSCCCSRPAMAPSFYPCPQCNPNENSRFSRHPAFLNNLSCTGNTSCGSCSTGNAATCGDTGPCGNSTGNATCNRNNNNNNNLVRTGGCNGIGGSGGGGSGGNVVNSINSNKIFAGGCSCPRLPGQGPCDPPCFSTMVLPRYAPFVPEPKCQPHPIVSPIIADGCSMAPVGGTSMYGAFTRSCFTCNNCGVPGQVDVCSLPSAGCNNAACASAFC